MRFLLDENISPLVAGILREAGHDAAHAREVVFRREEDRRAATQAGLILSNLDQVRDDIEAGAIVVIEAHRVRVRRLTQG